MSRQEVYQRYDTKTLVVKIKEDKELYKELKKEGIEHWFLIRVPKQHNLREKLRGPEKESSHRGDHRR